MAAAETIATLRRLANQPEDAEPYTNEKLNTRIDDADGDVRVVAAEIWTEKAATYADLVDVQEGSSRRALGDLYEQSIAMARQFGADVDTQRIARTRRIERP